MSAKKTRELELKFKMDVGELRALQMSASQNSELVEGPLTQKLRSIYFDTPDYGLRRAGISLRVREVDGAWVQTVKAGTAVIAGVSNPIESECPRETSRPSPEDIPDEDLRCAVLGITQDALLLPVFETVVERTLYRLRSVHGGEVELAVDMGHVFSDKGLEPIGEAELELVEGRAEALMHFASSLISGRIFKLANRSKATRGYILIGAELEKIPMPQGARLPDLAKDQSAEDAFILLVDAAVETILHNWFVTQSSDDPEGPHQLRVGLRLFRSLLKAFRPAIDGPAIKNLDRRARQVGHLIGRLRDIDVLIDDIYLPATHKRGKKTSNKERLLADRMGQYRKVVRAQVLEELKHWPSASFQIELALFTKVRPWRDQETALGRQESVMRLSEASLDKSYKRSRRWGKRLEGLDLRERHSMRKSLKTLRYQGEIFGSLYKPKRIRRFSSRLKDLQDVFGYLNDVAMAGRLGQVVRESGPVGSRDRRIINNVLSKHDKKARKVWQQAQKRWHDLDSARLFWR